MSIAIFEEMERASLSASPVLCLMIDNHITAFNNRLEYYKDILEKFNAGEISEDELLNADKFSKRHT